MVDPAERRVARVFRDEKAGPPRLALAASYWGLLQLPDEVASYIDQLCCMGFEYFEVGLRPERIAPANKIIRASGLQLIGQGWAKNFAEARHYFDLAHTLGAAAINMQLGHAYMSASEAAELVIACCEYANKTGLACIVETHRGCCTQDLPRTGTWLQLAPQTPLCLDLSHYIVAGEGWGGEKQLFLDHLQPIFKNTVLIHGRIGDGENVQSAVISEEKNSLTDQIVHIWVQAMTRWLNGAGRGDLLIFEPELGPPPYALVDAAGKEIADRWQQTIQIAQLGQKAWTMAQSSLH